MKHLWKYWATYGRPDYRRCIRCGVEQDNAGNFLWNRYVPNAGKCKPQEQSA